MSERLEPGRGAAREHAQDRDANRYVYVVRSRRTGAPSIGIDLTPRGECPWSCDYCQVPGDHPKSPPEPADLSVLRAELGEALEGASGEFDIAFAGAGEPTWSPSFADALAIAVSAAATHEPKPKVRVFTCASTLDRAEVLRTLVDLVASGSGEAWVKLDSWNDETLRAFSSIRGQAAHEARIVKLARAVPVVIQSFVAKRPGAPDFATTARGLADAVERILGAGAKIDRVVLTTVLRPLGHPERTVDACDAKELALVADAIRAKGVNVVTARVD